MDPQLKSALLEGGLNVSMFLVGSGVLATLIGALFKQGFDTLLRREDARLQLERDFRQTDSQKALDAYRAQLAREQESFKAELARDLEVHKVNLSATAERELATSRSALQLEHDRLMERLRSDLRIHAHEREVLLTTLHTKRAAAIEELYKRVLEAEVAFQEFMSPLQEFSIPLGASPDETDRLQREHTQGKSKKAMEAFNVLMACSVNHRIYFTPQTTALLDGLATQFREAWLDYTEEGIEWVRQGSRDQVLKRRAAWAKVTHELRPLKRDLERDFRRMLGIDSEVEAGGATPGASTPEA